MELIRVKKSKDLLIKKFKMQILSFRNKSRRLRRKFLRSPSPTNIFGDHSFALLLIQRNVLIGKMIWES
jgi:hypothetical protein